MRRALADVTAAELIKLRSLPPVLATALGTVLAAVALTAAAGDLGETVPFLQVGTVLLGVLAVAADLPAGHARPALLAVPDRRTLLLGKGLAYLAAGSLTSAAALGAGAATVWCGGEAAPDTGLLLGAGGHLVLIGLLGLAAALPLRSLVRALVAALGLVLLAPPLLAPLTDHARLLPGPAGGALFRLHGPGAEAALAPGTGALVLLGWIAVTTAAGVATFLRRDA
ncbi:ABC transporter permease [Streptomyces sp. 3MP-14]|uniref:ABC transporter permease n=1 Tax=Streptomyces mimosae TaxID=2586635 RepID=A0A5N6AQ78_9ACTN|nr:MULTISPECIES: ABC transporter permease [Streptomyces]KAB8170831.1 ABC transporter permease [Streptomyces mimosae]KAB8179817.1 ABC transporter permease [Streptomyces sp. 3MP-14]